MQRARQRQLELAFAANSDRSEPEGGNRAKASGVPGAKAWLRRIAKSKESICLAAEVTDTCRLLEQIASWPILAKALLNVAANKGAAGVDGQNVEEVVRNVRSLLPKLQHALLNGTYRPGDVRRVWIPKPGGKGQRGLGIPNVIDRWVQEATRLVLEPIFEPLFHDSSHGFRPKRGAQTAIAAAKRYIEEGYGVVVDLDLSKFFDRVNWQRLLARLAQRVSDKRVLSLIHQMLKAKVVMPDGTKIRVVEGTPQGGPLSPLLSNVVLNELDWELDRRGLRFVRYADDANIYVRSRRAGERVMEATRRFIEKRLRLKVNEEKSSVSTPDKVHILGFRLCREPDGTVQVHLSRRSHERLMQRIRELTPRTWGNSLSACMEQANQYLKGWEAYFDLCTRPCAKYWSSYDAHLRRRLRAIVIRQQKRPRYLYRHLLRRGVSKASAANMAYCRKGIWAQSNMRGIVRAYPNAWFAERLVSLWTLWRQRHPITLPDQSVSSGQQLLFAL
jgi:group II intron reverse transcriptase/maturase